MKYLGFILMVIVVYVDDFHLAEGEFRNGGILFFIIHLHTYLLHSLSDKKWVMREPNFTRPLATSRQSSAEGLPICISPAVSIVHVKHYLFAQILNANTFCCDYNIYWVYFNSNMGVQASYRKRTSRNYIPLLFVDAQGKTN